MVFIIIDKIETVYMTVLYDTVTFLLNDLIKLVIYVSKIYIFFNKEADEV